MKTKKYPKLQRKKTVVSCLIFLLALLLLFTLNIFIALQPLVMEPHSIANLGREQMETTAQTTHNYFSLPAGLYDIEPNGFASKTVRTTIKFFYKDYAYYIIKVYPSEGEPFLMPVCLPAGQAEQIRQGESLGLCGRIAELNNSGGHTYLSMYRDAIAGTQENYSDFCLNVGEETRLSCVFRIFVFSAAAFIVLFVAKRLIDVQCLFRKGRENYIGKTKEDMDRDWR